MTAAEIHIRRRRRTRRLDRLIFRAILLAGMLGVVAAVQLLVLLVLGRLPTDEERTVLIVSMLAAVIAALIYQPARTRLERFARGLLPAEREPPGEVLRALGTRLSRAVPLEELLLELAQSLRRDLVLEAAEIWTGSNGLYERAMSDPDRGWASLSLATAEESVLARSPGLRSSPACRVAPGTPGGSRRRTTQSRPDREQG